MSQAITRFRSVLPGPARSKRARRIFLTVSAVAHVGFAVGFVLVGATEYVGKMKSVGIEFDDMPIERWQVLIVMPIGYVMVGFRFLQILWYLITGKSTSLHLADEVADAMKLNTDKENA